MTLLPDLGNPTLINPPSGRPKPAGTTYHFDFEATPPDFTVDMDNHVELLTDLDTLEQQLTKALLTPRYTYLVYDHDYGNSLSDIANNSGYTGLALDSLLQGEIVATLQANPHVQVVTSCVIVHDVDDTVIATIKLLDTFSRSVEIEVTIILELT